MTTTRRKPRTLDPARLITAGIDAIQQDARDGADLPALTHRHAERLTHTITEAVLRDLYRKLLAEFVANTDDHTGAAEHHFGLITAHVNDLANAVQAARADQAPARMLVTGSRTWTDSTAVRDALTPFRRAGAVLVHGNAHGADRIAAGIWRSWGLPVEAHPADWDTHGRAAGMIRNRHMVALGAHVCLAFIRDQSRGATHCATLAEQAGIPTRRYRCGTRP